MVTVTGTLTIVGCSGSIPGPDSACSCYVVERDGYRLVLDLGTGAIGSLQRYARPTEVDAVYVSHAHGDHYHDLSGLVYLWSRAGRTDDKVPVYGPPQLAEVLADDWPGAAERFDFAGAPEQLGPWRVRTATVRHSAENWAVRLDDRLLYTGDSDPCPELDELAAGCAVILAEASGFDEDRSPSHLTAGDAGRLAAGAGARLLILTHLRSWQDRARLLAEAAAVAGCPVLLAQPGVTVSV
jgi:ribonuclease BN (tRNA processing enzyme)